MIPPGNVVIVRTDHSRISSRPRKVPKACSTYSASSVKLRQKSSQLPESEYCCTRPCMAAYASVISSALNRPSLTGSSNQNVF